MYFTLFDTDGELRKTFSLKGRREKNLSRKIFYLASKANVSSRVRPIELFISKNIDLLPDRRHISRILADLQSLLKRAFSPSGTFIRYKTVSGL